MASNGKDHRVISLRVDPDFYEDVQKRAEAEGRTLAGYVRIKISGTESDRLDELGRRLNRVEANCPGLDPKKSQSAA